MKKRIRISQLLVLIFLVSCNNNYEFWELNQFNINDSALSNGENISLLYASRAPDYQNEDYYVHFVVVSDVSGDTVNILSASNHHIGEKEDGQNFVFHSASSHIAKIVETKFNNVSDSILDTNEINKIQLPQFDKVIRDPSFDHIANNNYPTVFGIVMKIMNEGETVYDFL